MIGIAAYCTYGIIYAYIELDKIMWGAFLGILFSFRYILKDSLKVGYATMTQSIEKMTNLHKRFYYLQQAFSFGVYVSPLIIIFADLMYSKACIVLILIILITIILDLILWSIRKRNKDILV